MDTVNLVWYSHKVATSVIGGLEKLGASVKRTRDKDGKKIKTYRDHQNAMTRMVDGQKMYISYDPVLGRPEAPQLFMTIQLSKFKNWNQVMDWVKPIFGGEFEEFKNGIIRRVDCCIDLVLPFETVSKAIQQPKALRVDKFSGWGRRSLYLGKRPRETVVYERFDAGDVFDNEFEVEPFRNSAGEVLCTRVETRFSGNCRPIRQLSEIEKLRDMNPFERLRLMKVDDALVQYVSGEKENQINSYRYVSQEHGGQVARQKFNKNRNFNRDIGQYLVPLDLDFQKCWKRRTDRFFGTNPSVSVDHISEVAPVASSEPPSEMDSRHHQDPCDFLWEESDCGDEN